MEDSLITGDAKLSQVLSLRDFTDSSDSKYRAWHIQTLPVLRNFSFTENFVKLYFSRRKKKNGKIFF